MLKHTTGVTVLLPAIIIHVLDPKSLDNVARQAALNGFRQCILVLETLRDIYPTTDFAMQFAEAVIHKGEGRDTIWGCAVSPDV